MNDLSASAPSIGPLARRVALVTGGSRGIGRGIAEALSAAGATVAITYRRGASEAQAFVEGATAAGRAAAAYATPTGTDEEIAEVATALTNLFGPVAILVSNAGIASRGLSVVETSADEVQRVMASHAFAFHTWARVLVPGMRALDGASIVLISSSELTSMRANGAPYNMAKAAGEALASTLAHEEIRHRIRVNVVAPGLVATDMGDRLVRATIGAEDVASLDERQPLGRVTRPADIGATVLFLCSEQAAMITGQRIEVHAGMDDWTS